MFYIVLQWHRTASMSIVVLTVLTYKVGHLSQAKQCASLIAPFQFGSFRLASLQKKLTVEKNVPTTCRSRIIVIIALWQLLSYYFLQLFIHTHQEHRQVILLITCLCLIMRCLGTFPWALTFISLDVSIDHDYRSVQPRFRTSNFPVMIPACQVCTPLCQEETVSQCSVK